MEDQSKIKGAEDGKLTNEEIINRINAWQSAGFLHPLTCMESNHGKLIPVIENGTVILKCPKGKCGWFQQKIPTSVLEVSPELIEQEKQRLITLGFNFLKI